MADKQDKMAWFPLYVYMFITDIAGWNNREVGAYVRLLCYQWINKGLPCDKSRLAGMVQEPLSEFKIIWNTIGCKFKEINYLYVNPKLESVRAEQKVKAEKSSNAGKKAAADRWGTIMFPFNRESFGAHWEAWIDYKKKTFKFSYKTVVSEQGALDKLRELSNGDEGVALSILKQSMANQWQGLFPIKTGGGKVAKTGFTGRQDFNEAK
jgi:hypothetical protein